MAGELPAYPAKGNRRRLDEAWLELLHRDGLARFLRGIPTPPEELSLAVEEFNQGQYWQCHETLEGIWLPERYPLRLFYHGLIKAAVGLLHLERRNRHGALVKLGDARYTLSPFLPRFMGIDTQSLEQDVTTRLEQVQDSEQIDWEAIEHLPPARIHMMRQPYSQPGG